MALATRTTKPGSTTSFAESFGLGHTLQVADLDGDLNNIVTAVNDIDDSQIATAANIAGSKIAAGSITGTQLAAGAVTAALGTAAVTTAKIADGAVTTIKIADAAVTKAKLAINATVQAIAPLGNGIWPAFNSSSGETTLAATSSFTTRGGSVLVGGALSLTIRRVLTGESVMRFKLYRLLTMIAQWNITVRDSVASAVIEVPLVFPISWIDATPTPAAYIYTLTGECLDANWDVLAVATNAGAITAVELS